MPSETLRARLRLLAAAGLAAPALMIAAGLGMAYLAGAMPDLRQAPTLAQTGLGVGLAALTMGLIAVLSRISPTMAEALKETGTRMGRESLEMAGYPVMIVIVLMAGLSEEILFRGGLQPLIGLLPAAFLFGFSHGGWRREMWAYVLAAACSGTLFGLAYQWTGNLWVPVIAHSAHNLVSTFLIDKEIDITWEGRWPRIRLVDEAEVKQEKAAAARKVVREVQRMNRWESPYPMRPTARRLGLATGILPPGPQNDICDVPGVLVGHATVVQGAGPLAPGAGPVRTGVTAILPHAGNLFQEKVPAGLFVLNGFGKSLGLAQIQELGCIETPILLTNTLSAFRAADALVGWMLEANPSIGITTGTVNPVVGECNDGYLNDIQGRHITEEHVRAALASASSGPVRQGAVGAGTGMVCFGFKGGIGSASRVVGGYTLGALVLANFGRRGDLMVAGVPVGQRLEQAQTQASDRRATECEEPAGAAAASPDPQDVSPERHAGTPELQDAPPEPHDGTSEQQEVPPESDDVPPGSVMVVLATNAPLDARQLNRLAKRGALGLARTGASAANGSGDFIISFSTAHRIPHDAPMLLTCERLADGSPELDRLFLAAVEAVEEAVLNALFTAVTVTGRDGHTAPALPVEQVLACTVDRSFPRG